MSRRDAVAREVQADATTNLSMWLDRYALGFQQEVLRPHHAEAIDRIKLPEGYRRAFERRERALGELRGDYADGETRLYDLVLVGRAVVGIGMASVRETNLSLLRPWGVPFIPGSALKGLASHVAHAAGGPWLRPSQPGDKAGASQCAIFGDVTSAGAVVFHDAWWRPKGDRMPVDADTMTVHHAEYYQGQSAPADWDEPSPVSFLSVHDRYLAALTGPAEALDVAEEFLRRGLADLGVGAKTAAGYGRAALNRPLSEVVRALRDVAPQAAAANTVQAQAQGFLRLAAKVRSTEEKRMAAATAQRMVEASPAIWKKWVSGAARTDEERRWFQIELDRPRTPAAVPNVAEPRVRDATPQTERRRVRVKYIQDAKAPNRYYLRIEGEPKDIKGHLVPMAPEDLERVKAAAVEGAVVELEYENGRPRLSSGRK